MTVANEKEDPTSSVSQLSDAMTSTDGSRAEGAFVSLRGKRLLLAEEALKTEVGHFFEYNRAVALAHRSLGVETVVAAHRDIAPSVAENVNGIPAFEATSWDGIYAHPNALRRYFGVLQHNWLVYRDMRRFLRVNGPFDYVFAPTVSIHHLLGWTWLAKRRLGSDMDRLCLFFRNSIGAYDADGPPHLGRFKREIWQRCLAALRTEIAAGTVVLATDSTRLASEYELLAGVRPVVFPQPNAVVRQTRSVSFDPSVPFVIGCLGPARHEKGIDLLQAAISHALAARPDAQLRFVIQWNAPITLENGAIMTPYPALRADPRVEFLEKPLSSADYEAALDGLDAMALPYRRVSYAARISGVAVEAAAAGIPIIYTRDTWTADFVEEYGVGLGVSDESVDDLARALLELYDRRTELTSSARARAPLVQAAHSEAAFVRALWRLATPTGT
jgi:glycosyltransferase involved in cell wall biosynthesis